MSNSHIFRQLYSATGYSMISFNESESKPEESVYKVNKGFKVFWKNNLVETIHVLSYPNGDKKYFAFYDSQCHEMTDDCTTDLKFMVGK